MITKKRVALGAVGAIVAVGMFGACSGSTTPDVQSAPAASTAAAQAGDAPSASAPAGDVPADLAGTVVPREVLDRQPGPNDVPLFGEA